MPPVSEQNSGPNLSWMRPATTKLRANTTTAIVNTMEVSARFQPNCFSSGATKTLQAYRVPSAKFMETPPNTRHHRLIPYSGAWISVVVMVRFLPVAHVHHSICCDTQVIGAGMAVLAGC